VHDNVDVFDLLSYLQARNLKPRDVMLCVFNCAHGRNYREDSDARHALIRDLRWGPSTFRSAAFEAMSAQLPDATCVMTGRRWEPVVAQVCHRCILQTALRYGQQGGQAYLPEPSTRGDRRTGEVGDISELVATVAVGPALQSDVLGMAPEALDVPELAYRATALGGVVLFLGEFTLAASRHCVQYALERPPLGGGSMQLAAMQRQMPEEVRWNWRHRSRYTYADCLQHTHEKKEHQASLVAAHIWSQMMVKLPPNGRDSGETDPKAELERSAPTAVCSLEEGLAARGEREAQQL